MLDNSFTNLFPLTNPVLIFSIILFVILITPYIFKKIKVPHIVGLIVAGAIIGPHGLNLLLRDSSIELFGTVGLLYIMFTAGLEIDLADFKRSSHKSMIFGTYTFAIPMLLGFFVFLYVFKYPPISVILIASLFASHTLVAYPIITKYGVSKDKAVTIAIGGTLITDILALLVLSIVVGMSKSGISINFWTQLVINMIVMGVVITLFIPYISRKYLKNVNDNVSQYIFVLAIVFLSAFFAEITGFEAIIGAFLAGLAVNQLIPRKSPLMNRIEFIGSALFIPFFLIGVGMLIDFKAIFTDWLTITIAITMILIASVSKYLAALFTQKTFKLSADQRRVIFGLSNARAAATLAAVLKGYDIIIGITEAGEPIRLLNERILDGAILMILFTCIIASISAQKGAYNISLQNKEKEDDDSAQNSSRILIPISLEENVEELLNVGLSIKDNSPHSRLYALRILMTYEQDTALESQAKALLNKASMFVAGAGQEVKELLRYDFNVANGIYNVVLEQKISDLVIGLHHKKGLTDTFLGNITEGVLSKCNTNIFIYHPSQPFNTIKRLVCVFPENAEKELGFTSVIDRLLNLSTNNGIKLVVFADDLTQRRINELKKDNSIEIEAIPFSNWEDFLIVSSKVQENDGLFIFMSRMGNISYDIEMPRISKYLNKYFMKNSFVLVYPSQYGVENKPITKNYQQFALKKMFDKKEKT